MVTNARYDDGLYISQLVQLLHKLKWGKTLVVGYSLGGLVATGFASRFPEQVEGIGYVAPAGLMKVKL